MFSLQVLMYNLRWYLLAMAKNRFDMLCINLLNGYRKLSIQIVHFRFRSRTSSLPSVNYPTFFCLQPKGHVPQAQLSPTSDEYILDLLGTCEQKLLKLMDDLGGKDINDVMKEMEDAEVMLKFSGYLGIILLGRKKFR